MRPIVGLVLLILVAVGLAAYTSSLHPGSNDLQSGANEASKEEASKEEAKTPPEKTPPPTPLMTFEQAQAGAVRATMEVENRGDIVMELYPKAAPKTVAHFTDLAKRHFYDGVLFHRVVPDFVAQTGDPKSKEVNGAEISKLTSEEVASKYGLGHSGSGQNVPLEATLPQVANTVGLARSSQPDSGDSQFYINLKDNHDLDGQYCVFGRVVSGADIASKLQIGDRIKRITVQ